MPTTPAKDDDEAFMRSVTFPEEERPRWTTAPWRGEFRWFKAPNVMPLERWRRARGKEGGRWDVLNAQK
jgi:hypothetical protein